MRASCLPLLALFVLTSVAAQADPLPSALSRPALITPRAEHALTLDVALAGTRLVAVGERGVVLLSDDEAATWRQASSVPISVTLTAVRFASASEGWAIGHMGVILHTADGGETWRRQLDGSQIPAILHQAALALPDGPGKTSAIAAAEQLATDGPDKPFLDLAITPKALIVIGAYGLAVRSSDHGEHWAADADIKDEQGLHLYGLCWDGHRLSVAGEQGFLSVANEGGVFTPVKLPITATLFGCLALKGGSLMAYGLGGALALSGADGQWTHLASGVSGSITSALQLADGRILIGTDSGELALSDVVGTIFRPRPSGPPIPITHMVVVGKNLVLTGPAGPRTLPLAGLESGT